MDKTTYQKYVKADCWQLRRDTFIRHFEVCELCGHNKSSQVHHLTYERLGQELETDLAAVCERCHRAMHGLVGGTPLEWIRQFTESNLEFAEKYRTSYAVKYRAILSAVEARAPKEGAA